MCPSDGTVSESWNVGLGPKRVRISPGFLQVTSVIVISCYISISTDLLVSGRLKPLVRVDLWQNFFKEMGAASAVAEIKVAPKAKAAPGAMSSPTYGMVDLLAVRGMVVVMKHPHSWSLLGPDHIGRLIFADYLTFTIHSGKRGNIQEHNWKSLIFWTGKILGFPAGCRPLQPKLVIWWLELSKWQRLRGPSPRHSFGVFLYKLVVPLMMVWWPWSTWHYLTPQNISSFSIIKTA